jgi:hypothetical protein
MPLPTVLLACRSHWSFPLAGLSNRLSQILSLVIRTLFRRYPSLHRPPHLFCHGFQRACAKVENGLDLSLAPDMGGVLSVAPNFHVEEVKSPIWCALHHLLGQGSDKIIMELFLDCGIFSSVGVGEGNLYQLSG